MFMQRRSVFWVKPAKPFGCRTIVEKAIAGRKTVNVPDATHDSDYLTYLGSTRSEIIIPILSDLGDKVIGTIDIESEDLNAFDAEAQALLKECASALKSFWTKQN
jgi:L-methionine (R)-S-oxide reductase